MQSFSTESQLQKWFADDLFFDKSHISNEKALINTGKEKALALFHAAAKRVPAYKEFLKQHKIDPEKVKTSKDFLLVPLTTKKNYINVYSMEARTWDGKLDDMHMISTSSGTTGEPHAWPRNIEHEIEGAYAHEFIFNELFQIKQKKTLFLDGFAMGNWIAGTFTQACVQLVAWKNYPITIMTPGYSSSEILKVLTSSFINNFDQIIISGHVPFLKELVELIAHNVSLEKLPAIKLMGTGQGIDEKWRNYILSLIQATNSSSVINLYGSTDAALMGYETQHSITIRQYLADNLSETKRIFVDERLPSIYNFDPRLIHFEAIDKELIITKNYGCPLIRYNIHDHGGTLTYSNFKNEFPEKKQQQLFPNHCKYPFVYLYGRDKFMVKIYGANVYAEHVQSALNHLDLQKHLSGNFILESGFDSSQNPQLICHIELKKDVTIPTEEMTDIIKEIFLREVSKLNSEYQFVLREMGEKVHPVINLHEYGHHEHFPKGKVKKTA
jgi:phenylacetate-CoA ligase